MAGITQLKLYSLIRPYNFWVPSQTAGWMFTLGGIVSNSVHGGFYTKSYIHSYVKSLRVMTAD
eukprot:Pgem_evm1s7799